MDNADVRIACSVRDDGGLANANDASVELVTAVPANTTNPNAQTGVRSICDRTGNCATAGPVAGNKIDRISPSIAVRAPIEGWFYPSTVVPDYSCADDAAGSGVAGCSHVDQGVAVLSLLGLKVGLHTR